MKKQTVMAALSTASACTWGLVAVMNFIIVGLRSAHSKSIAFNMAVAASATALTFFSAGAVGWNLAKASNSPSPDGP